MLSCTVPRRLVGHASSEQLSQYLHVATPYSRTIAIKILHLVRLPALADIWCETGTFEHWRHRTTTITFRTSKLTDRLAMTAFTSGETASEMLLNSGLEGILLFYFWNVMSRSKLEKNIPRGPPKRRTMGSQSPTIPRGRLSLHVILFFRN
jgi:hypothetical protein